MRENGFRPREAVEGSVKLGLFAGAVSFAVGLPAMEIGAAAAGFEIFRKALRGEEGK